MYKEPNRKWTKILQNKYLLGSDPSNTFRTLNPPKGSRVWNFILDYRKLILDKISLDIANGSRVQFWSDSWGGYTTLDSIPISLKIKEVLSNFWGKYLRDYIDIPSGDPILGWRWKALDQAPLSRAEKRELRNISLERQIIIKTGEDKIVWIGSNSGDYKVKEGYAEMTKSQ